MCIGESTVKCQKIQKQRKNNNKKFFLVPGKPWNNLYNCTAQKQSCSEQQGTHFTDGIVLSPVQSLLPMEMGSLGGPTSWVHLPMPQQEASLEWVAALPLVFSEEGPEPCLRVMGYAASRHGTALPAACGNLPPSAFHSVTAFPQPVQKPSALSTHTV